MEKQSIDNVDYRRRETSSVNQLEEIEIEPFRKKQIKIRKCFYVDSLLY